MSATLAAFSPSLPLSALELKEAVRAARPYDAARLDRCLRMDASRGLVEVQASATWASLAAYAGMPWGERWSHCPGIREAVATNAPGPDGRPTVQHVEALAVVTPDGELRRASRDANPELFALAVGGQGLFGALYSVTLRLESLARAAADALPSAQLRIAPGGAARPLQLLVPPEALEALLAEARQRCAEWRIAIQAVDVRACLPEDDTWLRWATREYAWLRLDLAQPSTLGGTVRTTQLRRELIDIAISHGGAFPVSCTPEATRAQAEACYPKLRSFLAEKRRLDPSGKLDNAWFRHYTSLLGRETCDNRWNQEAAA
jgi:hypothetical protein